MSKKTSNKIRKQGEKSLNKKDVQREHIFQAALICFSSKGVRRTNMSDVAREAGVSRTSIYYYFKDKESLVVEFILRLQIDAYQVRGNSLNESATCIDAIIDAATLGAVSGLNNPYLNKITQLESERLTAAALNSDNVLKARKAYWGILLDNARGSGELREDVNDDEIVRWLVFLQFQLVMSGRLIGCHDYASIRRTFELFVLPALQK